MMYFDFSSFSQLSIIIAVLFAIGCFFLASHKKRNPWLWGLLGLVFGLWASLVLLLFPDGDLEDEVLQLKARVRSLEADRDEDTPPTVKVEKPNAE